MGVVLPHLHPKYDSKNGSLMDHLKLFSRLPQLPLSLLLFHNFIDVLEDMANEGSPSGLIQPLLFAVENMNHNTFGHKHYLHAHQKSNIQSNFLIQQQAKRKILFQLII